MQIAQNLIFEASCTFLIDAGEIYGTGKTESGINVKLRSMSTLEPALPLTMSCTLNIPRDNGGCHRGAMALQEIK